MIWEQEDILQNGKAFRFKTRPIDPTDPFRGKYIVLSFDAEEYPVYKPDQWVTDQTAYAILQEDDSGFAEISTLLQEEPTGGEDYIQTKIAYVHDYGESPYLRLDLPFNRYYMEESKAYEAEVISRQSFRGGEDNRKPAYAVVRVKDGRATLEDVIVGGLPIKEAVLQARKE
jgi:uncharacterized membrane-anchored protein